MFETAECDDYKEFHIFEAEIQLKGCVVELKESDWQMSAWTALACDTVSVKVVLCGLSTAGTTMSTATAHESATSSSSSTVGTTRNTLAITTCRPFS